MIDDLEKYGLDMHGTMILEQYREMMPVYEKMNAVVADTLRQKVDEANLDVTAIETRIKKEKSLAGKLELKGSKYQDIFSLTDIVGARVITFYTDDVDRISAIIEKNFTVDWKNSIDKRRMHELDSFGYMSLHYICSIPESLYCDPEMPQLNRIRFEVQMRTALQHVWANLDHDTGYKKGIEVPKEYLRSLTRLAGLLELADDEFSRIRLQISDYRRKVESLVRDGRFEEVALNGDTFRSYIAMNPFESLMRRIASINQAEIHTVTPAPYLDAFVHLGFTTLADLEQLKEKYSDKAFHLSLIQLGDTDIDIVSSTLAMQNLCIVYILASGGGEAELKSFFDIINGVSPYNESRAKRLMEQAKKLPKD